MTATPKTAQRRFLNSFALVSVFFARMSQSNPLAVSIASASCVTCMNFTGARMEEIPGSAKNGP